MGREFGTDDDFKGARFVETDLTGAEFREATLSDARFVGVVAHDVEIEGLISNLRVNGVEVMQFVEAELDRRHPERLFFRSSDPDDLRKGWDSVVSAWNGTAARIAELPVRQQNERVDGEWSAIETLRHLVFVTDAWFRRSVLGVERPFHPIGLAADFAPHQQEMGLDPEAHPTLGQVLEVRAEQAAEISAWLDTVTGEDMEGPGVATTEPGWPVDPTDETVLGCIQVLLDEEWWHHQFCVRDLASLT